MCETLRTLPKARPLSWSVEVEVLRALVRALRAGLAPVRTSAHRHLPDGAVEYALMEPAEREQRRGEFSLSAVELVAAMERTR